MSWLKNNRDAPLYVGSKQTTVGQATSWVEPYLTQHNIDPISKKPYSYPAYDKYPGNPEPELGHQDLLAPILLNVCPTVKAYYTLSEAMDDINARLHRLDASFPGPEVASLARATEKQLAAIAEVFGALDSIRRRGGVRLTIFAKVMHRKRPELLPLWDRRVQNCYCFGAEDRRIEQPSDVPTFYEFARLWLPVVQRDLIEGHAAWSELASFASEDAPVSHLRVLDIVAWNLGREI